MPATRVVLMASAMDNDWLLPGHPHGLAVSKVDRLLLLNNSRDHALKRYWVVSGSHQVPALGFAGSCRVGRLGSVEQRIEQHDVSRWVGSEHSVQSYLETPHISRLIRRDALPQQR
jgi:hypothetical protein